MLLVRSFIQDLVLQSDPKDEVFLLCRISTRKDLIACFPDYTKTTLKAKEYHRILGPIPRIPGTHLFYSFERNQGPWWIGLTLGKGFDWAAVKAAVIDERSEKSLEEIYGLCKMASDVLAWLLSKNYTSFDLNLSPDVEKALKLEIGIDIEKVGKKNLWQLFNLLCQEISEKTEYEAKTVPWAEGYYEPTLRLFFRKKIDLQETAIRSIRCWLSAHGAIRDEAEIAELLSSFKARFGDG